MSLHSLSWDTTNTPSMQFTNTVYFSCLFLFNNTYLICHHSITNKQGVFLVTIFKISKSYVNIECHSWNIKQRQYYNWAKGEYLSHLYLTLTELCIISKRSHEYLPSHLYLSLIELCIISKRSHEYLPSHLYLTLIELCIISKRSHEYLPSHLYLSLRLVGRFHGV